MNRGFSQFISYLLLGLVLVGCGTSKGGRGNPEARLAAFYQEWRGAPYQLGGITKSGVDCSAFVQQAMRHAYGVQLPRVTADQIREGTRIRPNRIKTGDLVFFRTGPNTMHVGIVIGNNRFMHASTSQGVTITELKNVYWRERFLQARRVI